MSRLGRYAWLAWAGHFFALLCIHQAAWDGFCLAVAVDLPYQLLLLRWAWGVAGAPRWPNPPLRPRSLRYY